MKLSEIFKQIRDWWNDQELRDELSQSVADRMNLTHQVHQLSFLLNQAPMQNAPADSIQAMHAVTKFAYVHPKTLWKLSGGSFDSNGTAAIKLNPRLPTFWIATPSMPEYGVIYTPNPMPGFEHLAARP